MKVTSGFFLIISATSILARAPALILTHLIKKNQPELAKNLSLVDPKLFLNRTSYSGFLTVDEKYNSNIFFWYFQAENYKPDTPWIIWLQGGPGATSLAGLFDEIGPLEYTKEGLKLRQWSWAKDHSLLFIDNPVGAGFSFTDSPDGFIQDMSTCANHLYSALRQFLKVFPELRKPPLYIAGESYAGRYIPGFAVKILEQDRDIGLLEVNLQGLILGNPVLNRESISDYSTIYYQWGLIDSQGLLAVKPLQDSYEKALDAGESEAAVLLREELLTRLGDISMQQQSFNILRDDLSNIGSFKNFVSLPHISDALHTGDIKFSFTNETTHNRLNGAFLTEVKSKVEILLDHYRILIYCGHMDLTAPCVPNARARRRHWHWNQRDKFLNASRIPWWHNNRVAGYVKSGGGLTEVLVRGAGHLVPMDKPEETTYLITSFIKHFDMKLPPNYQVIPEDTPPFVDDDMEGIPKTIYQIPGEDNYTGTKAAMVVSIIINVLLVAGIVLGLLYLIRWKRRTDAYLYNSVDESNISSTMF